MKRLACLLALFFCAHVWSYWNPQLSIEGRSFPSDDNELTQEESLSFDFSLIGDGDTSWGSYKVDLMQRYDSLQAERNLFLPKELLWRPSFLPSLTVGWQIFNPSVLEYFHPTMQLNAFNQESSVEDFERFGALSLSYAFEWGDSLLQLHYLPLASENFYPERTSRTGFGVAVEDMLYAQDGQLEENRWASQYAFHFSTVGDNIDFGIQGGRILSNDTITFALDSGVPGEESVQPIQFWKNFVSTTVSYVWGDWLLKGEYLFNDFDRENVQYPYDVYITSPITAVITTELNYSSPRDYSVAAVGVERMIDLWGNHQLTMYLEHQKILGLDAATAASYHPFQNDVVTGFRWSWNDVEDSTFQVFWVRDLSGIDEYLMFGSFSQRLTNKLRYSFGGVLVDSNAAASKFNSLSPIEDVDYLYLKTTYYF